jgi:DNA polymerase-4
MRTIIHADMDAFYASVEQLDKPELRGKPVAVGGSPEGRGVVAAASYEARAFGVRSAMPMSRAMRLCPELVRVSPRFGRYGEVSHAVMGLFRALTPLVEPLSLDEAFLDVSGWVTDGATPATIARELKVEVKAKTGLTISCGVGTSKSVAKIASDMRKPDGMVVVAPGTEATFLAPLPVRSLWGIGPKAEQRLVAAGIRTIGDLAACGDAQAQRLLGSGGAFIRDMARGIDEREVITDHERKSIGAETTFAKDLPDGTELRRELHQLAEEVGRRMRSAGARGSTVSIKLRYSYFKTITRQHTLAAPTDETATIESTAAMLLEAAVGPGDMFRLLGIQCSKLIDEGGVQGVLWAPLHREDEA